MEAGAIGPHCTDSISDNAEAAAFHASGRNSLFVGQLKRLLGSGGACASNPAAGLTRIYLRGDLGSVDEIGAVMSGGSERRADSQVRAKREPRPEPHVGRRPQRQTFHRG